MTEHALNALLLRALENMLALVPDARISGACKTIAADVIREAREAVALARGERQ